MLTYLFGTVLVELVSADPAAALTFYGSKGIQFRDPTLTAPLTLTMTMDEKNWARLQPLAQRRGDRCRCVRRSGAAAGLSRRKKRLPFCFAIALVLAFTLYAPKRVWFVEVEGNLSVPSRQIVAAAAECGVHFWADAEEIRSEKIKNQILNLVPELQWAGVNFSGGIAVISVRERLDGEPVRERGSVTDVVASRDGVIVSMSVLGGQALCQVGQAVRAGELMVTGCVDHETCIQYTHADAEVYAMTQRQLQAVYPLQWGQKAYTGQVRRQYSLVLGRKRINLSGNSGISDVTCDKMTEEKVLTLPGGYSLPVSLVVETLRPYEAAAVPASPQEAKAVLTSFSRQMALADTIAGEILDEIPSFSQRGGLACLDITFSCQEMIARQRPVNLFFEGEDTND